MIEQNITHVGKMALDGKDHEIDVNYMSIVKWI